MNGERGAGPGLDGSRALARFRLFMVIAALVSFALAGLFARWLPDYPWVTLILTVFGLHSVFVALLRKERLLATNRGGLKLDGIGSWRGTRWMPRLGCSGRWPIRFGYGS